MRSVLIQGQVVLDALLENANSDFDLLWQILQSPDVMGYISQADFDRLFVDTARASGIDVASSLTHHLGKVLTIYDPAQMPEIDLVITPRSAIFSESELKPVLSVSAYLERLTLDMVYRDQLTHSKSHKRLTQWLRKFSESSIDPFLAIPFALTFLMQGMGLFDRLLGLDKEENVKFASLDLGGIEYTPKHNSDFSLAEKRDWQGKAQTLQDFIETHVALLNDDIHPSSLNVDVTTSHSTDSLILDLEPLHGLFGNAGIGAAVQSQMVQRLRPLSAVVSQNTMSDVNRILFSMPFRLEKFDQFFYQDDSELDNSTIDSNPSEDLSIDHTKGEYDGEPIEAGGGQLPEPVDIQLLPVSFDNDVYEDNDPQISRLDISIDVSLVDDSFQLNHSNLLDSPIARLVEVSLTASFDGDELFSGENIYEYADLNSQESSVLELPTISSGEVSAVIPSSLSLHFSFFSVTSDGNDIFHEQVISNDFSYAKNTAPNRPPFLTVESGSSISYSFDGYDGFFQPLLLDVSLEWTISQADLQYAPLMMTFEGDFVVNSFSSPILSEKDFTLGLKSSDSIDQTQSLFFQLQVSDFISVAHQ